MSPLAGPGKPLCSQPTAPSISTANPKPISPRHSLKHSKSLDPSLLAPVPRKRLWPQSSPLLKPSAPVEPSVLFEVPIPSQAGAGLDQKSLPTPSSRRRQRPGDKNNELQPELVVSIRVGTGDEVKVFYLNRKALSSASRYFSFSFNGIEGSNSTDEITLPTEDPVTFELFVKWIQRNQRPIAYKPGNYSDDIWVSYAAPAWSLARQLGSNGFEKYALSQFIQNCALAPFGPWEYVEQNAPRGSSLCRFSNHWVAWNSHLAGPGVNEYTGLRAAKRADQVTDKTLDPGIFDLDHWYLRCGDHINPNCLHNPLARQQKREDDLFQNRPRTPEWNSDVELPFRRKYPRSVKKVRRTSSLFINNP